MYRVSTRNLLAYQCGMGEAFAFGTIGLLTYGTRVPRPYVPLPHLAHPSHLAHNSYIIDPSIIL